MLLEITDGTVSRGGRAVLSHFDFAVRGTEKIAIVGRNGAGKTTLLQLLAGELELETNEKNPASGMRTARRISAGILHQNAIPDQNLTAAELLPGGDRCSFAADRLLTGFGFRKEELGKPVSAFSGGEQEKLAMIRLLLEEPDLLLLDEPTNHLDTETCEWLESWLRTYPKAVVTVSHDRWFLDRTADVIYEVQSGRLTRYPGNYTRYREEKQARVMREKKAWERQQEERKRLEQLILRFRNRPNKASFARSRQKLLDRMTLVEKPEEDTARIRTGDLLPARRSGKWVFQAENLTIGWMGSFTRTVDLRIRRGQKTALMGPNGSGKTTLLRTLSGTLAPAAGRLSVGTHVDIGYFDQKSAELNACEDVITWFRERFPALTEQEARHTLAGYLFSGRDVRRPVNDLSGGEKARLALAAILEERPNVLILDEPTNHMDLPARETIESILRAYRGTLLVVSHDRYFISRTAESLFLFEGKEIRYFPGNYEEWTSRKKACEEKGLDISAVRTMKEQAMIESFQAVPAGSRLPGALSTRELSRDWRLRELEREMRAAEEAFRGAETEAAAIREHMREDWLADMCNENNPAAGTRSRERETEEADRRLRVLTDRWTETCLAWYEEWNGQ